MEIKINPKSSEYLYGQINLDQLKQMTYPEALQQKIQWAQAIINQLLQYPIKDCPDPDRLTACFKAVRFNQKLFDELEH